MRKKNILFLLIVILAVSIFGYRFFSTKINQAAVVDFVEKNTAQQAEITVSENELQNQTNTYGNYEMTVTEDTLTPGIYDLSTKSTQAIGFGRYIVQEEYPIYHVPLAKNQKISWSNAGTITFTPSKIAALSLVNYNGEEVYQLPGRGYYYVEQQLPAGKYELYYDQELIGSTEDASGKQDSDITVATYDYELEDPLWVDNVMATKQPKKIQIDLTKAKVLYIDFRNPPSDLTVYLKEIE